MDLAQLPPLIFPLVYWYVVGKLPEFSSPPAVHFVTNSFQANDKCVELPRY